MSETLPRTRATGTDHISVSGADYDLSDIKTVSLIRPVLNRGIGWGVAIAGLIILVLGYVVWGTFLPPLLGGICLIIAGLVVAFIVKPSYTVRMARVQGEAVQISFPTEQSASDALTQIDKAIGQRRADDAAPLEQELGA